MKEGSEAEQHTGGRRASPAPSSTITARVKVMDPRSSGRRVDAAVDLRQNHGSKRPKHEQLSPQTTTWV